MPIAQKAYDLLIKHHVVATIQVLSFHRNAEMLFAFVKNSQAKVFIAFAGGAAHLAGAIASHTLCPVIGVPVKISLEGMDALLSTVQMPSGVPVATVAINGAENAAILAMQILAVGNEQILNELTLMRNELRNL
jgi:5-(carboxyamino)imidazole ribonucleotide mutase